jgi:uncharacterized pyridoxal phosphate-containing UPF0001 family protein
MTPIHTDFHVIGSLTSQKISRVDRRNRVLLETDRQKVAWRVNRGGRSHVGFMQGSAPEKTMGRNNSKRIVTDKLHNKASRGRLGG